MTEQTQTPEQETAKSLNLSDLDAVVRFIDIACQRGIVRGDEMVAVGTLRQNIDEFLTFAKASQEAHTKLAEEAEAPEEEEVPVAEDMG